MNKLFSMICLSALFGCSPVKGPVDYVDIFVGTSNSRAMLGPYAAVPYGMVQLGADNQDAHWMGGYEYSINNVKGFTHIHAWMMNGLMIMPAVQDLVTREGSSSSPYRGANAGYHSRILKETEKGEPGYYSVFLYDADCQAELTATNHCGFHKYTFANDYDNARIMLDLNYPAEYGTDIHEGYFKVISDQEIEGYADTRVAGDYILHYNIKFNKPFKTFNGWKDESVLVQVSLSLVDQQGCKNNYEAELKPYGWDFDAVHQAAKQEWNTLLSKIEVEGDEADKKKFYTNLYRAYAKQTWSDADGRYRDPLENIQQTQNKQPMYGGDAFWNTFWNFNPLLALISPDILNNWVLTQLELFDKTGWTNNGPTGLEHTGIMEVTHEIALMVGAYQKGIRKYDVNKLWEAVYHNATEEGRWIEGSGYADQRNLNAYRKKGYVPIETGAACQTLDYAYTDFCTAQLAKALAFLREQAAEWHIDPDQIAVMGFSAGGHLAASLGNFWNSPFLKEQLAGETEAGKEPAVLAERIRPNAQILCYPVISGIKSPHEGSFRNLIGPGPEAGFRERCRELSMEKCVGPDTPPTFLWHCLPDDTVPAVNSLLMAEALWKERVPVELHLYGTGGHALGTADALSLSVDSRGVQPECANWMELCHTWLKHIWKEAV